MLTGLAVQFDWPLAAKAVEVTGDFWEWKRREKLVPLSTGGFRLSTYLQPGPGPSPPFALSAKVVHELSCVWLAVPLAVAEACSGVQESTNLSSSSTAVGASPSFAMW